MNEEITKEEYIILREQMNKINKKLIELEDVYDDLIVNVNDNFIINDRTIFEDDFNKIKKELKNIKEETINEVIPIINNKI